MTSEDLLVTDEGRCHESSVGAQNPPIATPCRYDPGGVPVTTGRPSNTILGSRFPAFVTRG